MVSDRLLTVAAWLYVHWRDVGELLGLLLLVAAAASVDPLLGVAAAGIAAVLFATYGGRAPPS